LTLSTLAEQLACLCAARLTEGEGDHDPAEDVAAEHSGGESTETGYRCQRRRRLPGSRLLRYIDGGVAKISLSSVQAIVAIAAGVLTVLGGVYPFWQNVKKDLGGSK
jgi:hypothetical protein